MRFKIIRCLLSVALILSSLSINTYADTGTKSETNSITINKENDGDSILLPSEMLDSKGIEIKDRTGNIKIALSDISGKNDKSNVKFGLSKVADVVDGEYKVLDKYRSVNIDLNNIKNSNDLEIAASLYEKVATEDTVLITDNKGECEVNDLKVGVYLLFATDIANYENITPFLISIPTWSEKNGVMNYDIEIIPKHTPIPETPPITPPSTGYSSKENIYYGIALVSFIGVVGAIALGNKKKIKSVEK